MSSARIVRLDAWPIDVPLTKPFGIAGGAQEVARNAVVRVQLEDGTVGHGEAAPFPAFNGDTQEAALEAIARARDAIIGCDVADWKRAATLSREGIGPSGSARCAIETAALDASFRARRMRMFGWEGCHDTLRTDVTIPIGPVEECAADAGGWVERGFGRLKIKIGGAGFDDARARIVAVHRAAPAAELLLDGNAGLSSRDAVELLRALEVEGIRPILFEQPCAKDDLDGLYAVAAAGEVPVALDETVSTAADVERFASRRDFEARRFVVNVKLMKSGYGDALGVAEAAGAKYGMRLMIGGMVEARMAMSASACLAASGMLAVDWAFVDLDTPLFLAEDPFEGGYAQTGDRLDLSPITAGHGVVPRDSRPSG